MVASSGMMFISTFMEVCLLVLKFISGEGHMGMM